MMGIDSINLDAPIPPSIIDRGRVGGRVGNREQQFQWSENAFNSEIIERRAREILRRQEEEEALRFQQEREDNLRRMETTEDTGF